jgi:hypothetical protein
MKRYREATSAEDARARFVVVEDDGSVRELSEAECEFLARPFEPSDGGRPYVKSRYGSRTPDNRLGGFLERNDLPRRRYGIAFGAFLIVLAIMILALMEPSSRIGSIIAAVVLGALGVDQLISSLRGSASLLERVGPLP